MRAGFKPPRGNAAEKHHRDDVECKHPCVPVRRNVVELPVHEGRFGQKGEHRTEAECLKKQITHRGTGFQYALEPPRHQPEHIPADFAADGGIGQEILYQTGQHRRIRRQENENRPPSAQSLQQCADHGSGQRHNHQNDADKGKHLRGFASGIIIAHHRTDDDYSHACAERLYRTQVKELFGTRSKYDGGNGKAIYNQTGQGDGFAPFDVGHRAAGHLPERRAEHKQTQTLFDTVDIRVQRLRHFGNRGQVGIGGKRHQRDQYRHQNRHQFSSHRRKGRRHGFSVQIK